MPKVLQFPSFLIILILLLPFESGVAIPIPAVIKLTGHPAVDFEPTISPDNNWIAFTSFRDGDFNIYLKSTSRGLPRAVTSHSSADFSPCYDEEGKSLYFVSRRDDALGDIYRLNLETKSTDRITNRQGYDIDPAISPDGRHIALCSDRETGYLEVFIALKNGEIIKRITTGGGISPCWSPDGRHLAFIALDATGLGGDNRLAIADSSGQIEYVETGPGPVMNPQYSSDGSIIFFTHYCVDTDKDGALTINDIPCISGYYLRSHQTVKFIFKPHAVYYPVPDHQAKWIYYTISDRSGINLAKSDLSILLKIYSFPDSLFQYGMELARSREREDRLAAIQYLESCAIIYPAYDGSTKAIIKCGDIYQQEGFYREADLAWAAADSISLRPADKFLARIKRVQLETNRQWDLDRRSALKKALNSLAEMREESGDEPATVSEVHYTAGILLFRYGNFREALKSFQTVIDSFAVNDETACRAILRMGDLYSVLNPDDRLSNASNYLRVIASHPDRQDFADSAVAYALNQYADLPPNDRIVGMRHLMESFPDIRLLRAAGKFNIAKVLEESGNFYSAIDQYATVFISCPEQLSYSQQARLLSAKTKIATGAADEGLAELDSLMKSKDALDEVRLQAGNELYEYLLNAASSSFEENDYDKSQNSFQGMIRQFPDRGDCHWGFVMSCALKNGLDYAQEFYDSLEIAIGENRGITYGRALVSLKRYDAKGSKSELRRSRRLLENLNDEYFEWIFPYVALGEVYLKFEKGDIAPDESGFSERAIDIASIGISNLNPGSPKALRHSLELNAATGYFNIGQFSQAFSYYRSCRDFVDHRGDSKLLNDYLWNLGEAALQIDSMKVAAECFQELLRIAEEKSDAQFRLQILKKLGFVYLADENFDDAQRYFELALEIYKSRSDLHHEAEMLKALATVSFIDMENARCEESASKSDSIYISLGSIGDLKTSGLLLGRLPLLPVDFQIAELEEFKIGGSFYPKGFPFNISERLLRNYEAESNVRQGDIDAAAFYFKAKMQSEMKVGDRKSMAITSNRLGNLYQNAGNPDSAFAYFYKAMNISKEAKILSGAATNAINLCNLFLAYPGLALRVDPPIISGIESNLSESLEKLPGDISALKMYLHCAIGAWIYSRFHNDAGKITRGYEFKLINADGPASAAVIGHQEMANFGIELKKAILHFQSAAIMAKRLENKYGLSAINLNLATIYFDLGLSIDSQNSLIQARDLAVENGFSDILWRVFMIKGLSDPVPNSSLAALEDAVKIMRNLRGGKNPFAFREELPELNEYYSAYLKKLIDSGEPDEALNAVELYRSMTLAGEFSRYPLREFRSELHKVYWQNIRYFDQMVDSLTSMIRALEIRKDAAALKAADSLNIELGNIRTELDNTLARIKSDFPALVPMVYPSVPDTLLLQTVLGQESCILDYRLFKDGLGIWYIDADTIEFSFRPLNIGSLSNIINSLQDSMGDPFVNDHLKYLFDLLIHDHRARLEDRSHVYIIPDQILSKIPFSALNDGETALLDICDYSISSSISMILNGYQNRRVPSPKIMVIPSKSDLSSFAIPDYFVASADSIPDALTNYGVLIFGGGIQAKDDYPLGSRLVMPMEISPQLSELLRYRLNCKAVILRNSNDIDWAEMLPIFQAVFNYAGSSSLVISRWTIPDSIFNRFLELLVPKLSVSDVATALGSAKNEFRNRYPDSRFWAGFEQIGFRGMDKPQEITFAQQQFGEIMLKANISAKEESWEDALEYFEKAYQLSPRLNLEPAKTDVLLQRVVFSAFKAANYRIAEKYQKQVLELAQSRGDTHSIGKVLLLLRDIANSGGFFESAAGYQRQYMAVASDKTDSLETAIGFRNVASLYDSGAKYELALSAIDTALANLPPDYKGKEYAATEFIRGRILINSGDYRQAASALQIAVAIFDSLSSPDRAAAYQLLGLAHFKQFRYLRSEGYLTTACDLYRNANDSANAARCAQILSSVKWAVGDYDSAEVLADFAANYSQHRGIANGYLDAILTKAAIKIYSGYKGEGEKLLINGFAEADSLKSHLHRAVFSDNLGRYYLREKQYGKAVDFLRLAITIPQEGKGNLRERIESLLDLSLAIAHEGNLSSAMEFLTQANFLITSTQNEFLRMKYHLIYASILESNGKFKYAIKYLNETLTTSTSRVFEELQWRYSYLLARCFYNENDLASAQEALMKAVTLLDSIPVIPEGELLRSRLPYHPADAYRLLAAVQFSNGNYQTSLQNFQKSFQYSQTSLLASHRYRFKDARLDSLASQLTASQIEYYSLINRSHDSKIDSLWESLDELGNHRSQYFASLSAIRSAYPTVFLLFAVPSLEMTPMAQALEGSCALAYFIDANKLYRFFTDGARVEGAVSTTALNFSDLTRQYSSAITSLGQAGRLDSLLCSFLIAGLENELKGYRKIAIIPNGSIAGLPFGCLIPKWMGADSATMTINVIPSIYDIYIRNEDIRHESFDGIAYLLPDEDERTLQDGFWKKALARQEVRRTYPMRRGQDFRHLLETQTPPFIISDIGIFANDGQPLNYTLGGAPTGSDTAMVDLAWLVENRNGNGFIFEFDGGNSLPTILPPDQAILLWRVLLCSGLSGIILPYWNYNDFERGIFLKRFLQEIESSSPENALAKTQKEIIDSGRSHPYYWAGYYYLGFSR
ncbi:MAG: hypothetical protein CO189_01975 [candidate division Zixibacteria bacterium CG_4_9_14_3_um_filter_46_8]|nr:MAG: hypothetical protein CO189_01975 [candidate division Zixibacteria bacterium CG_4_9_14_3_um_filter_46_8]